MEIFDPVERLLNEPYLLVDLFPKRVPADCATRYFSAERFFLSDPQHAEIAERFVRFLLKLNCYEAFRFIDPGTDESFEPADAEAAANALRACLHSETPAALLILLPDADALITLDRDDLYLTLYHPSPALTETVRMLAAAEGLFAREPEPENA